MTLKDNTRSTEEAFGAELDRREVAIFEVSGTLFFLAGPTAARVTHDTRSRSLTVDLGSLQNDQINCVDTKTQEPDKT